MTEASQTPTPDTPLFRDVFNASPIGIAVVNLEGQPLFVNPAFCSMLGFSEEELRSKHCVDFSPPEDAEKDWALFEQLRAGSIDHYQLEKRYFRRDGSLLWGYLSISLLNSRPCPLILAIVEDITDKRAAKEVGFRHAAIVESSEDAIVSKTLDGVILSWNKGAQQIYGYTEAETIGKPINMIVPHELLEEENKILEELRAGGRFEHYETVRVTKGGQRINISLSISPIKDSTGKPVGFCGIARDITEKKRHQQALRESEERLRLAQQIARIGTFERDIQTGVVTWSAELESMYGLQPGDFEGTTTDFFTNLVHPDDREEVMQLINETIKTGRPITAEWRVLWPDGSVHWIAGHWQVLMNESGEPSRMIGVNMDVTARKQADQSLADMTRKLIEAQEQERSRIGRELHDDINQRLAMLAVELGHLQENPSESQSSMQELRKQVTEISNDVQALSHDLHSSKLEYLGVVAGIKSWCKEFAERQKIAINFRSSVQNVLPLEVGRTLFRVLQEALHNSIKHSGVKHVEVQLLEDGSEVHMVVGDLGKGFDLEAALQGIGLGLISMRERVRLVNGAIAIESKPMGGTTIHVRVPLEPERGSQRAAG